jgi:hypothetical protein
MIQNPKKKQKMNPRLHELAIRAGFVYINQEGIGWAGMYNSSLPKFAELIVRECANLETEIELVGLPSEDYEQGFWDGLQMYQNQIKQHFGWIE